MLGHDVKAIKPLSGQSSYDGSMKYRENAEYLERKITVHVADTIKAASFPLAIVYQTPESRTFGRMGAHEAYSCRWGVCATTRGGWVVLYGAILGHTRSDRFGRYPL
eukprot:SAG11_NODE_14128_length_623_cov_0.843810_2_plen_107_part_00